MVTNPATLNEVATEAQIQSMIADVNINELKRSKIYQAEDRAIESIRRKTEKTGSGWYAEYQRCVNEVEAKTDAKLAELLPIKKINLKTTVIFTSLSLIGQWYVCTKHGTNGSTQEHS